MDNKLTEREEEVLNLILNGLTNNEIAKKLVISNHTIKAHKEHIFSKMNVRNTVQLVVKYYKQKEINIKRQNY